MAIVEVFPVFSELSFIKTPQMKYPAKTVIQDIVGRGPRAARSNQQLPICQHLLSFPMQGLGCWPASTLTTMNEGEPWELLWGAWLWGFWVSSA